MFLSLKNSYLSHCFVFRALNFEFLTENPCHMICWVLLTETIFWQLLDIRRLG